MARRSALKRALLQILTEPHCERAVVPRFMRGIQRGGFVVDVLNHTGFRGQAAERRALLTNLLKPAFQNTMLAIF